MSALHPPYAKHFGLIRDAKQFSVTACVRERPTHSRQYGPYVMPELYKLVPLVWESKVEFEVQREMHNLMCASLSKQLSEDAKRSRTDGKPQH